MFMHEAQHGRRLDYRGYRPSSSLAEVQLGKEGKVHAFLAAAQLGPGSTDSVFGASVKYRQLTA